MACAQVSGRLEWLTDDRFRGFSLSDRHPAVQASVNLDHASGAYAGALVSVATPFAGSSPQNLRLYAGYAHALDGDSLTWDAGVVAYRFGHTEWPAPPNYIEWFAGASAASWNTRLYLSGNYAGLKAPSAYLELNAAKPVLARLALTGHIGVFHWISTSPVAPSLPVNRIDFRAGMDLTLDPAVLGLALVDAWPRQGLCYSGQKHCGVHTILSVATKF
jgi:uncharacterized protein (TIGR02001 family)